MSDLAYRLSELERKLNNLLRFGTVETIDLEAKRVTVRCGQIVTAPLPWFTARSGAVRTWCPLSIGEQVMILSPGGDLAQGGVLPSLFSGAFPAPSALGTVTRMEFEDGGFVEYDHAPGKLSISTVGDALIEVAGKATVAAVGDVEVITQGKHIIDAAAGVEIR